MSSVINQLEDLLEGLDPVVTEDYVDFTLKQQNEVQSMHELSNFCKPSMINFSLFFLSFLLTSSDLFLQTIFQNIYVHCVKYHWCSSIVTDNNEIK